MQGILLLDHVMGGTNIRVCVNGNEERIVCHDRLIYLAFHLFCYDMLEKKNVSLNS